MKNVGRQGVRGAVKYLSPAGNADNAIRELDRVTLGAGSRGPLTEKIQAAFFDIVNGRNPKYAEWLTLV